MANSAAFARIKADVIAIVERLPAGRVATHGEIGRHLAVFPRHVAYILATLDDDERERVPWWRVVADGGAVGRHLRRDDQIARLKADHVPLSAAGIVQELGERRVGDFTKPIAARAATPAPTSPQSRSRGSKDKPTSSV
jgi:methylated-DNA-protein-cysteine methyltransferase related protein